MKELDEMSFDERTINSLIESACSFGIIKFRKEYPGSERIVASRFAAERTEHDVRDAVRRLGEDTVLQHQREVYVQAYLNVLLEHRDHNTYATE